MLRDEEIILVRQSVTMRQVAEAYGLRIYRGNMVCCPFHGTDKHPSMKLYDGSRGYYCFTCHAGGDVISFVMKQEGIAFDEAVRRIAQMFHIPLSAGDEMSEEVKQAIAAQKAEREAAEKAKTEAKNMLKEITEQIHRLKALQAEFKPLSGLWCGIQRKLERLEGEWEYRFDLLGERR